MCRLKQKRNALIIILVGAIISALICSECLILNTTASVPRGLWLKLDTLPQKGDFVQVPIDAFSSTEWVPHEYFRKNIWGKNKPFLKKVAGLPTSMEEEPDDRFVEACQMFAYIEYLADLLTVGDLEQRKAVVMELMQDGKITGLEDRVNRAHEKERRSDDAEKINAAS